MKRPTIRDEIVAIILNSTGDICREFGFDEDEVADAILKSRKFVVRRRAVGRKG